MPRGFGSVSARSWRVTSAPACPKWPGFHPSFPDLAARSRRVTATRCHDPRWPRGWRRARIVERRITRRHPPLLPPGFLPGTIRCAMRLEVFRPPLLRVLASPLGSTRLRAGLLPFARSNIRAVPLAADRATTSRDRARHPVAWRAPPPWRVRPRRRCRRSPTTLAPRRRARRPCRRRTSSPDQGWVRYGEQTRVNLRERCRTTPSFESRCSASSTSALSASM